jgi:hypothetical protein
VTPSRALAAALAPLLAACAGAPDRTVRVPAASGEAEEDLGPLELDVAEHEVAVVAALGRGDPSLAARFGLRPSLADEPSASDPSASGGSNWLSPRERARGLDEAERALAEWTVPARILRGASPRAHELRLERELCARMLKEERFRYEHERQLPRSASALVRAAVAAYGAAPADDPRPLHEWWIARRLEEIRASLRSAPLPLLEADELDDALDPLERLDLATVRAPLAALRVELGAARKTTEAQRAADPAELERLVAAHLGTIAPFAATRSRLGRAEATLRDEVRTQAARLSSEDVQRAEQDAERLLLGSAPCGQPESKMRRALPPPERAPACAALASVVLAKDERATLAATIALHDHAAMALWAVAARADGLGADAAQAKTRLLAAVPPDRSARFLRLAIVHPAVAIGAGLGAELLYRRGAANARNVAEAWSAFGDAPLDIVDREVLK